MIDNEFLEKFALMSQAIGANPAYVQGGGGNTSAKLSGNRMVVKASGLTLAQVTPQAGYANVDYAAIREYLKTPDEDENRFNANVISSNSSKQYRPSMETGFHAALNGYVIHSHSVYVNVVSCAEDGKSIAQKIMPESVWVPYVSPGRALTLDVDKNKNKNSDVFFLQNHGLIVRADTAEDAIELHEAVNQKVRQHLGLDSDFSVAAETVHSREFMDANMLFPDQVIYTDPTANLEGTTAARETLAAYAYLIRELKAHGMKPKLLQPSDAAFLRCMDAEKHRKQVTS